MTSSKYGRDNVVAASEQCPVAHSVAEIHINLLFCLAEKINKDKKLGSGTSVGKKSVSSKTNAIHQPL